MLVGSVAALAATSSGQSAFAHVDRVLTGVAKTVHFDIRFRPGSRAAASVDRTMVMAERDFADICEKLQFRPRARFVLYLYDDGRELSTITRTSGNAGFSSGNVSHVPYDNDQTRYHEMVHVVAYRLPTTGDEKRSLFFAEGLANALLEFVHGVHVHAVAAYYFGNDELPAVSEMTGAPDFYAWLRKRPGFNAYDVGASWLRFLIDEHGIEKVKRYYTGTPATDAFGASEKELERGWRAMLANYELRPALRTLLQRRSGETVRFSSLITDPDQRLPTELLGKPSDWTSLMAADLAPDRADRWTRDGDEIAGRSTTANWELCRLGTEKLGDAALRARIKPVAGTVGVQVQLGKRCQLMLTNAGTFVWREGVVEQERSERIDGRDEIDLLLVRRGDRVTGYLDGLMVVQGIATDEPGAPAIGVAGGRARFVSIQLRRW